MAQSIKGLFDHSEKVPAGQQLRPGDFRLNHSGESLDFCKKPHTVQNEYDAWYRARIPTGWELVRSGIPEEGMFILCANGIWQHVMPKFVKQGSRTIKPLIRRRADMYEIGACAGNIPAGFVQARKGPIRRDCWVWALDSDGAIRWVRQKTDDYYTPPSFPGRVRFSGILGFEWVHNTQVADPAQCLWFDGTTWVVGRPPEDIGIQDTITLLSSSTSTRMEVGAKACTGTGSALMFACAVEPEDTTREAPSQPSLPGFEDVTPAKCLEVMRQANKQLRKDSTSVRAFKSDVYMDIRRDDTVKPLQRMISRLQDLQDAGDKAWRESEHHGD